jgi:hypothetical protein
MSDLFAEDDGADPLDFVSTKTPRRKRPPRRRLPLLSSKFVRVPLSWLAERHAGGPFDAKARIFLLVLLHSFWGQKGVKLTNEMAAGIGVSPSRKTRCLARLEESGWVRVERSGRQAPTVWPVV